MTYSRDERAAPAPAWDRRRSFALLEDYHDQLDEKGHRFLVRVRSETQRMGQLIDELLLLSRVTRSPIQKVAVDLTAIAETVADRLRESQRRILT